MSANLRTLIPLVASLVPLSTSAQAYRPSHVPPRGTELLAVYVTAPTCHACRAREMPATLDRIKVMLQRQAQAAGQRFRAVFVAVDWEPDSGLALAREDGPWDEIIVGRNWYNAGVEQYVWGDTATKPELPQIILIEQRIEIGARVRFEQAHVLRRLIGLEAFQPWLRQGLPRAP